MQFLAEFSALRITLKLQWKWKHWSESNPGNIELLTIA